jgi:hypothetical protein
MKFHRTDESSLREGSSLRSCLSNSCEAENLLNLVVSDEALETAAGASAEGNPTLAFGSYCLTCPVLFDIQ